MKVSLRTTRGRDQIPLSTSSIALLLLFVSTLHCPVSAQDETPKRKVKEQERPSPALLEEQRADSKAMVKADRVIADFSKGNSKPLWQILRRDADPSVRAYVIERLSSS